MLSILVDAHKQRDLATAYVVGAYLRAHMDDVVIMKVTGEFIDILCGIKPKFKILGTYEDGVKVLFVLLKKAV
jgi:hypothetical protein